MSSLNQSISTGDIIGVYVPEFGRSGQPGEKFRNALVLGLEVSTETNDIAGIYVCRLSERTHLIRSWDYFLDRSAINRNEQVGESDFVLRTCRVDLLPYTEEFFGPETFVYGKVEQENFPQILRKIQHGLSSRFKAESWGPRPKLDNSFICTNLESDKTYPHFSMEDLLATQNDRPPEAPSGKLSFAQEFERAVRELAQQTREKGAELHRAFLQARFSSHQNTPFQP